MSDDPHGERINRGYLLEELRKALHSAGESAPRRVAAFLQVLAGMADGSLNIGARAPVRGIPAWATPQVVHGGLATGNLAAGGPLLAHERARAERLRLPEGPGRTALNLSFLDEQGLAELATLAATGRFRLRVAEEGALLIVQWLHSNAAPARAEALLAELAPFFDRLRFYPAPAPEPRPEGALTRREEAGTAVERLRRLRPHPDVEAMREAISVWRPMTARAVALFRESERDGLPLSVTPPGWEERAQALLADYLRAKAQHPLCRKPHRPKENFARLRRYLERFLEAPPSIGPRDREAIRRILANHDAKHSAQKTEADRVHATRPSHAALARVVASRLESSGPVGGLTPEQLDLALRPVTAAELTEPGSQRADHVVPAPVAARACRALEAPLEVLQQRGLIPSQEVLANLMVPLVAHGRAQSIPDPDLRRIWRASYEAFSRRRSLLLLDLQSQTRFRELPWIDAIEPWTRPGPAEQQLMRGLLADVVTLALVSFPQTMLPNRLVSQLRSLATAAGLSLPWVEELAADIFMGTFSPHFVRAAHLAAESLQGTLYARYYDLPIEAIRAIPVPTAQAGAPAHSPAFALLCQQRAGVDQGSGSVAENGKVIEQAQILTTANLAVAVEALQLRARLPVDSLAETTFRWIRRRHQQRFDDRRSRLQMIKNTAYAWRQLIYFLSLGRPESGPAFLQRARRDLASRGGPVRERLTPVLDGLEAVLGGERFDAEGVHAASGGRRFTGWARGMHWLADDARR